MNSLTQAEQMDLRTVAKHFEEKLKKIKICLFDVDGILTNGQIMYDGEEVGFNRFFHALDGYGLKVLQGAGIKVGIVTSGDSLGVIKRFKENLELDFVFYGNEDKRTAWNEVKKSENVSDEQILYMGDEFFDLPLLLAAGFSATVSHASHEIKESVDYITLAPAGMGSAREVIDLVRYAQKIKPEVLNFDGELCKL